MKAESQERLEFLSTLIAKQVQDLRAMCLFFTPVNNIISHQGFFRSVEHEMKTRYPEAVFVTEEGDRLFQVFNDDQVLMLFSILLELLIMIDASLKGRLFSVLIKCLPRELQVVFDHSGRMFSKPKSNTGHDHSGLPVFERVELLGGCLRQKREQSGLKRIKLVIPLNEQL